MATRRERISESNLLLVSKMNLLKTLIGDLNALSTTNSSNLVASINEVLGIANSGANSVQINDAVANLTETWSSTKISTEIATAVTNALEGEDLSDIADQIASLIQADNGLVSATAPQSFTPAQIAQAQSNIDSASATEVGDTDYDFVAEINSNLSF